MTYSIASRFWSKVLKTGSCWLWTGAHDSGGYGNFAVTQSHCVKAHRYSWEIHFGPVPDGLAVCHHCDNPECVCPTHLFLGTWADNAADRELKGRGNQPKGICNGNAKLTNDAIIDIRFLYTTGMVTQRELASIYGVTQHLINLVVRRMAWRHVT